MKILSQNKSAVVFTENADSICEYLEKSEKLEYEIRAYIGGVNCYCELGKYSTEEKATGVIRMIFESNADRFIMPANSEVVV